MEPSCPLGTTRCIPQEKFHQKPYNKSFIDQVCSVKMAGYWPRSFFASLWTSTSSRSGFCSMKRLEVFLLPLDGMLVHRRSLPRNFARFPQQFAGTHLYTWVERGTVRVKCLAQEHNTMSPASARTRTARSGVERTKHEATAPLSVHKHAKKELGQYPAILTSHLVNNPYALSGFLKTKKIKEISSCSCVCHQKGR